MIESNGERLFPPGEGRKPTWDEKDQIIMATERGDVDTLVSISHKGIDVTAAHGVSEVNLLHIATNYGHYKLMHLLLHSGVPVDVTDANHWTPLHVAAWRGRSKCIQILCEGGATLDAKCKEGRTPLHIAASNNFIKTIETLVNAGATVDIPDKYGHTALTEAVRQDHGAAAVVLINKCKAKRSEVPAWYQEKLWKVLKKEEEKTKALASEDTHTKSSQHPQQEFNVKVLTPSGGTQQSPNTEKNSLPHDEINKSEDVEQHCHHNFAETLLGGIMWTGVTSSAGVIGYVIGDDVGVYTGALCALVTGVVSISVFQWGYRTFSSTGH